MSKNVVVWGDDHHNALGLLRMLGNQDFDVLFLVHRIKCNIATASKYCKKYIIVNSIDDGIKYLLTNFSDKKNKAVLLFTADVYSEAANRNLNKLKDYFFIAGPSKEGILKELNDKYIMGMMAAKCGLNIPKTTIIPIESLDDVTCFPAIIKPCSPIAKDFKTRIVQNKKQLIKAAKFFIPNKRYIIQSYIEKDSDGLIYGCRTWDGDVHLAGICVRNRWSDDGCGSFGYLTPNIPESVCALGVKKFLEEIDFRGLFSVEYALTEDNAFFYEFNLRNDGTSVLFFNAGANIALSFVNSCFKIKDDVQVKIKEKKYLMHEILDVFNVYDGNVSYKQWKMDKKKATIHFLYDPNDIKPYKLQKSQMIKKIIHHIISQTWINKMRLMIKNKYKNRQ